jgi:hypothetical protein
MKRLKRLKILIILETEAFYLPAVQLVSKIVSLLKQSAEFFYAKNFEEALRYEQEKKMLSEHYDAIFMFAETSGLETNSVLDNVGLATIKTPSFFLSPSSELIEEIKCEMNADLSPRLYQVYEKIELPDEDLQNIVSCIYYSIP